MIHIPERDEGYGPSRQAVDEFVQNGADLLITGRLRHNGF